MSSLFHVVVPLPTLATIRMVTMMTPAVVVTVTPSASPKSITRQLCRHHLFQATQIVLRPQTLASSQTPLALNHMELAKPSHLLD
jgi:hypothetical protein